jgi:hypothetical protein
MHETSLGFVDAGKVNMKNQPRAVQETYQLAFDEVNGASRAWRYCRCWLQQVLRKRHIESGYVEYPACFAAALHLERQLCGLDRSDEVDDYAELKEKRALTFGNELCDWLKVG